MKKPITTFLKRQVRILNHKTQLAEEEEKAMLELLIEIEEENKRCLVAYDDPLENLFRGPAYGKKIDMSDFRNMREQDEGKEADFSGKGYTPHNSK